jgi:hypothetical protein
MMETDFRDIIISELSTELAPSLVSELIESYEKILIEFRKAAWDETLWKAGKFVENVFRLLDNLVHSRVLDQVPNMNELKKELESLPSSKFQDSIRILIPRIATAMIYDPRSKKGAVHVKPMNPDFLDATLTVAASDWILAEFLRLYHSSDTERIQQIIKSILVRKIPFVEKHGGVSFVTHPMKNAEDEILLLLLDAQDGMDRKAVGISLGNTYTPGRVTQAIDELLKKRYIIKRLDGQHVISGPGETHISEELSKFT